eukprot:3045204-Pyramimonas_sp.AAC.1
MGVTGEAVGGGWREDIRHLPIRHGQARPELPAPEAEERGVGGHLDRAAGRGVGDATRGPE